MLPANLRSGYSSGKALQKKLVSFENLVLFGWFYIEYRRNCKKKIKKEVNDSYGVGKPINTQDKVSLGQKKKNRKEKQSENLQC